MNKNIAASLLLPAELFFNSCKLPFSSKRQKKKVKVTLYPTNYLHVAIKADRGNVENDCDYEAIRINCPRSVLFVQENASRSAFFAHPPAPTIC